MMTPAEAYERSLYLRLHELQAQISAVQNEISVVGAILVMERRDREKQEKADRRKLPPLPPTTHEEETHGFRD